MSESSDARQMRRQMAVIWNWNGMELYKGHYMYSIDDEISDS
jgi:hypothetical protein